MAAGVGPGHDGTMDTNHTTTRPERLERSTDNRMIAGVAAGIARHWNLDVALVRAGFVVTTIFGGFGAVAYLVAWLLLPGAGEERSRADDLMDRLRGADGGQLAGIVLLGVGVLVALGTVGALGSPIVIAALLIVAGVILANRR